jgi:hypothetical protein
MYNKLMTFFKRNIKRIIATACALALPVIFVYAADCDPTKMICNPIPGTTTLTGLIQTILVKAVQIGLPIVVLAIVYAGFLFVSARGNTEKLSKAKETLLYTLIGAAILLGSWTIAQIIKSTVDALK